jgi:hypothetical protein
MSEEKKVWIVMTDKTTKQKTVVEATDYQKYGYYEFMRNPERPTFVYNEGEYFFTIHLFNGDKQSRLCLYINQSGDQRILSDDKEALDKYVMQQNAANQKAANQKAARQEAPLSPAGDVYIYMMDGSKPVSKADANQADSYHTFMSNLYLSNATFTYPRDPTRQFSAFNSDVITLAKFDEGLKRSSRFCNIMVSGKAVYILSDDQKALESHIASGRKVWREGGGNRTTRSRKTKRSKRMHTSKRK